MSDKPISRRLRFEILKRDGHACRYCGATAPDVVLTVDHVIPRALGGDDEPSNLVAACRDCNYGKASVHPGDQVVADVADDALRWARAMEKAAARQLAERRNANALLGDFDAAWLRWRDHDGNHIERDGDWRQSVLRWASLGLDLDDFHHLVDVAMRADVANHKRWRYLCGCCWRLLEERQELARRIIEDGEA